MGHYRVVEEQKDRERRKDHKKGGKMDLGGNFKRKRKEIKSIWWVHEGENY